MSMPFYISPEQLMADRADYARKGIARGRAVIVATCTEGIVFATENHSQALHKISEIYDRIGFAAVGKYNEFEALRVAGIRYADLRGYSYDRSDVTARALAHAYAQTLGTAFTTESKPMEVEVVVAELGHDASGDEIYHLSYDGSVAQEHGCVVIGGDQDTIDAVFRSSWEPTMSLVETLTAITQALSQPPQKDAEHTMVTPAPTYEAALLDRSRPRRTFRRLTVTDFVPSTQGTRS